MNADEFAIAKDLYEGCWPNITVDDRTMRVWVIKFRATPADRLYQAIVDLADGERRPPDVGTLVERVRVIGNREAIQQAAEARDELPSGDSDRAWQSLDEDDKRKWLHEARMQWPEWADVPADSPLLTAHAAALHRGIPPMAEPKPCGRCRGCGGQMMLVDRPTRTAKCDRCYVEFVLDATHKGFEPRPIQQPEFRRCSCGAALLGFDPDGDECRNCAPQRTRA